MIKWFQINCKMVEISWEHINNYEEIYIETSRGLLQGPFIVEDKEKKTFRNLGGRLLSWEDFYPPTTLFQRIV